MSTTFNRLTLAALTCAIALPAGAQLIERKELSYPIALTVATRRSSRRWQPGRCGASRPRCPT